MGQPNHFPGDLDNNGQCPGACAGREETGHNTLDNLGRILEEKEEMRGLRGGEMGTGAWIGGAEVRPYEGAAAAAVGAGAGAIVMSS